MIRHQLVTDSSGLHSSNQDAPIIDLATDLTIGYLSPEYLNTAARAGLTFFHNDKDWKILHISDEETVYVLPSKDPATLLESPSPSLKEETHDIKQNTSGNASRGLPIPSRELIILESSKKYIIFHSLFGAPINTTLRLVFDAMLTEQDLIRDSYNDATRILVQTPTKLTREELESVSSDLFHVGPGEFDRLLQEAIDARFPLIAASGVRQAKASKTGHILKEALKASLDVKGSKALLKGIAKGRIKVRTYSSLLKATPLAQELIDEYTEMTTLGFEMLIKNNVIRLRASIERKDARLLCLNCLSNQATSRISQLEEKPECKQCGSHLLALPTTSIETISNLLHKKKSLKPLSETEIKQLARARRTADLTLSYGKKAIIALAVTGIGPQTASTILASMPLNDSDFYYELLKARIHYLTTRELWDGKRNRAISFANRGRFNSQPIL